MNPPVIAIVVPCYNEEQALPLTLEKLKKILGGMVADGMISQSSYVLCCDDGSIDKTWEVICREHDADHHVKGLSLAHNRGHQYALLAGLMTARGNCDAAISIDADLQDDPMAIVEMVRLFKNGSEIVYGVRSSRETDTLFKRTTARMFYKIQKAMGLQTIYDHADYRLMSNRALNLLSEYGESNLFLRGIIPQIGLKTSIVTYERHVRVAGESKYPLSKMLSFSVDGITSFTSKPIRLIFFTGLVLMALDVLLAVYVFISYFGHSSVPGWTSLMLSVWFLGSLLLISLGIVGEYVGKIFTEVKGRPRYAVREYLLDD